MKRCFLNTRSVDSNALYSFLSIVHLTYNRVGYDRMTEDMKHLTANVLKTVSAQINKKGEAEMEKHLVLKVVRELSFKEINLPINDFAVPLHQFNE